MIRPETDHSVPQLLLGTAGSSSHPPSTLSVENLLFFKAQLTSFKKQLTVKLENNWKWVLSQQKRELQNVLKEIQEKGFGELLESVGKKYGPNERTVEIGVIRDDYFLVPIL